ncbi:MAG TPA: hypothetical protein VIN01_03880 [Candidatus Dormibacteraeota bacterium]|jgi:hypothetical protein
MGRPLQRTLAIVATVVVGAFLLFGQGKAAPLSAGPTPALAAMPACADADVIFRLSTSSPVYLPGQPVRITFEVRNAGARWCKVAGQCGEVAPISVFDGHRMLWSDRPCYNHEWDAVKIPLAPGRLVSYLGSWSTQGVGAGLYEVRAAFLKTSFVVL